MPATCAAGPLEIHGGFASYERPCAVERFRSAIRYEGLAGCALAPRSSWPSSLARSDPGEAFCVLSDEERGTVRGGEAQLCERPALAEPNMALSLVNIRFRRPEASQRLAEIQELQIELLQERRS